MKLLKNEYEYRGWMENEFLHHNVPYPSILEADEIERELLRQMPDEFPCIVLVIKGPSPHETEVLQFLYRTQVREWAKLLGI